MLSTTYTEIFACPILPKTKFPQRGWGRSRAEFLGRLQRVDLIISIWDSDVRPFARTSVRPSAKSFSDYDEIWYIGRGRWVMHDGMPYDLVKVKVTRPLKLQILWLSKFISSPIFNVSWQMTTDSETTEQYLTFVLSRFLSRISILLLTRDIDIAILSIRLSVRP